MAQRGWFSWSRMPRSAAVIMRTPRRLLFSARGCGSLSMTRRAPWDYGSPGSRRLEPAGRCIYKAGDGSIAAGIATSKRRWIAHALRPSPAGSAALDGHSLAGFAGVPALSGQMIFTPGGKCLYQTSAAELLLTILAGERLDYQRPTPRREALPAPVLKVLTCILGAAGGAPAAPPRMEIRTAYGLVLAEAQWLLPAAFPPADAARDPKTCLIRLTIELREHALAHAARVLRELGASPAQIKVGAWLAMGKTKPEIARALGIKLGTAADLARKLYRILGVHNAAELGRKVWLTAGQSYPQHVKRGQAGGSS